MSTFVCFWFKPEGFDSYSNKPAKYTSQHVNILYNMLQRHGKHDLICVTDCDPSSLHWMIRVIPIPDEVRFLAKAYYPKLWAWSRNFGDMIGEPYAVIDLDVVITSDPGVYFKDFARHGGELMIWDFAKGGDVYNTSFFILDPGARHQVWDHFITFGDTKARKHYTRKGFRYTGDQSVVSYVLGEEEFIWHEGRESGIYKFQSRLHSDRMPEWHTMSFTCGPGTPLDALKHCKWINEAYR